MTTTATTFPFGENWLAFLRSVDDAAVLSAEADLATMLGDIRGKTFLDVGCGSGLSSLAAVRLGAKVTSFDADPQCVECAKELQRRFGLIWPVEQRSILGTPLVEKFDVVYSWGVLHHTGDLWTAIDNTCRLVTPGGTLWVSIYNDQGLRSRYWRAVKWLYNVSAPTRAIVYITHLPLLIARYAVRAGMKLERGMSIYRDHIDWLGGHPFEVATPNAIINHLERRGFSTIKTKLVGRRTGCNDFVFRAPH